MQLECEKEPRNTECNLQSQDMPQLLLTDKYNSLVWESEDH